MIVCKQCGTIFEEIYQTCPKCGTVYQFLPENSYDLPRRKMPGEPEFINAENSDPGYLEINLKSFGKKKSKAPTVVLVLIAFALMIAVAVALAVYFSEKNSDQSTDIPKTESEEQLDPPQKVSDSNISEDGSSVENSMEETSTEQTSLEEPLNNTEITAEVTKIEPNEEAYTDNENIFHEATFKVFVSYTVNGNEYEIEWGIFPFSEYSIGDKFSINLDPGNPAKIIDF